MDLLISWAVLTFSMYVATRLLDGIRIKGGPLDHFVVSAIFGTLSFFVGWLVYVVLGLLSLGVGFLPVFAFITRLVTMAILLKLTDRLTNRLKIESFGTAFVASFIMAIVGAGTEWALSLVLH